MQTVTIRDRYLVVSLTKSQNEALSMIFKMDPSFGPGPVSAMEGSFNWVDPNDKPGVKYTLN